jgi:oxygen-independent coproporphyrinogen-3 oxidase
MDQPELQLDLNLIDKLNRSGPRYTSYPTADRFVASFDSRAYANWAARRDTGVRRPLSLYVHLPFCASPCYFCACNKIVTRDPSKAIRYLSYLYREIALQAPLFRDDARVEQMHWGGGTPTFYATEDLATLFQSLRTHFDFAPDGEYSIEVDPRSIDALSIGELRAMGFNRLSFGVQDCSDDVQRAVNRVQSAEQVSRLIEAGRTCGFGSINVDLIYGLPCQTPGSFGETIDRVVELRPNRVAVYSYAHLPARFKAQKQIRETELPSSTTKLALLATAAERLTKSGYVYIGMDHFALPDDTLAIAQREGRLHRNFQGYSTHADCDLIGVGVSAIGAVGPSYSQNARTLSDYYGRLDRNDLPIARGVELTRDDLARRAVIHRLMCQFAISKEAIGVSYLLDFDRYFQRELDGLREFERDGLVELQPDWIFVTPKGRFLVRSICMLFDRYLQAEPAAIHYSRTM